MKKLIFICHGNTFRSQIAEAIFNSNHKEGWVACSYGTAVSEQNIQGLKISQSPWDVKNLIDGMKKLNMDISEKYCDQLMSEYLENVDKVIVMTEVEFTPEWLSKRNYERWEIPNAKFITPEILDEVVKLLSNKIEILKRSL